MGLQNADTSPPLESPRTREEGLGWGCMDCQSHGSRASSQSMSTLLTPYPVLSVLQTAMQRPEKLGGKGVS